MLHKTKGIVLKTVKYGETSLVATVFTELFGMQSYIVNGVRNTKKSNHKANLYQPSSILNLVVYHNEHKTLQRISDASWHYLYKSILDDVFKNCIALFLVELMYKSMNEAEDNIEIYDFIEESFIQLDEASKELTANYAPYFSFRLGSFLGFQILNNYSQTNHLFDLQAGRFKNEVQSIYLIDEPYSGWIAKFLNATSTNEVAAIKLNKNIRIELLKIIEKFYQLHVSEFGSLQTLKILPSIFNS